MADYREYLTPAQLQAHLTAFRGVLEGLGRQPEVYRLGCSEWPALLALLPAEERVQAERFQHAEWEGAMWRLEQAAERCLVLVCADGMTAGYRPDTTAEPISD